MHKKQSHQKASPYLQIFKIKFHFPPNSPWIMESFRPHFDRPSLFWPACRAHPSGRLGSNLATVHHRRKHVEVTSAPGVTWPAPSACVSQLKAQTVVTWRAAVSQETHSASLISFPAFLHKPGLDFQSSRPRKQQLWILKSELLEKKIKPVLLLSL